MQEANTRVNYGIDAPGLVRFFFIGGIAAATLFLFGVIALRDHTWWAISLKYISGVAATYLTGMGCLMLYWSKVTKVKGRDLVLDEISWRGDEQVLDVGCGRGLMLVGAARRLTTGRAMGIDIWQAKDQSANTADGALTNATLEGVLEKVEIRTADMRSIPFLDESFDVVVSHWVVHNLEIEADRSLSLKEMVRVLKPEGAVILCDIENRDAYIKQLTELGMKDCRMKFSRLQDAVLGFLSFGSFRPTTIFARKSL
jgi:arsenite methyltransferase